MEELSGKNISEAYTQIAPQWDQMLQQDPYHWQGELLALLRRFPGGGKLLDVGCGTGREAALFSQYPGVDYTGIDITAACLALAQAKHRYGRFLQMDARKMNFPEDEFSAMWSTAVIHHLLQDEAEDAVKEMHRVSKPGAPGFIATSEGNAAEMVSSPLAPDYKVPMVQWNRERFSNLLTAHRFRIEDMQSSAGYLRVSVTRL